MKALKKQREKKLVNDSNTQVEDHSIKVAKLTFKQQVLVAAIGILGIIAVPIINKCPQFESSDLIVSRAQKTQERINFEKHKIIEDAKRYRNEIRNPRLIEIVDNLITNITNKSAEQSQLSSDYLNDLKQGNTERAEMERNESVETIHGINNEVVNANSAVNAVIATELVSNPCRELEVFSRWEPRVIHDDYIQKMQVMEKKCRESKKPATTDWSIEGCGNKAGNRTLTAEQKPLNLEKIRNYNNYNIRPIDLREKHSFKDFQCNLNTKPDAFNNAGSLDELGGATSIFSDYETSVVGIVN